MWCTALQCNSQLHLKYACLDLMIRSPHEFTNFFHKIVCCCILKLKGRKNKRKLDFMKKHNGKPLHDRERLVRQSLEDISRATLDVSGYPRNLWDLWGSLGIFGDLWGSLEIFGDLLSLALLKVRLFSFLIQDETFRFSHSE